MQKWIFLFLVLFSHGALASGASICAAKLEFLDPQLIAVLDDLARLQVQSLEADPSTGFGVKLQSVIKEKFEKLQGLLPDDETLDVARDYLREKVIKLQESEADDAKKTETDAERDQRDEEEKFLKPYEPLGIDEIKVSSLNAVTLTPDGIFIGQQDNSRFLIKDLVSGDERTVIIPADVWGRTIANYVASTGELLLGLEKYVVSVKPREILNSGAKEYHVTLKNKVTPNTSKMWVLKRMQAAGRRVDPKGDAGFHGFKSFQVSANGRYLYTTYRSYGEDYKVTFKATSNILIYDRKLNVFKALATPKNAKEMIGVEGALSPDGRTMIFDLYDEAYGYAELWGVKSGKRLRNFPFVAKALAFSHDGKWVAGNNVTDKIFVFDPSGKNPSKVIDLPTAGPQAYVAIHPDKLSFSDDDTKLIASNLRGQIWTWDLKTGQLLEQAMVSGSYPQFTADREILLTKKYSGAKGDPDRVLLWKRKALK